MHRSLLQLSIVVVLFAAACSGGGDAAVDDSAVETTTTTGATLQCAEPLTIGVVADLSGGLSIYGSELERGVAAGLAYAAGAPVGSGTEQTYQIEDCEVRVVYGDDQSNPDVADVIAERFIREEGVDILVGSVSANTTTALVDVATQRDVILLATTDTPTGLGEAAFTENVFLLAPSPAQEAYATCGFYAAARGVMTFAQIAPDFAGGQRAAEAYRRACIAAGGEFVTDDTLIPASTTDFATPAVALAAAEPEAVLLTWTGGGLGSLLEAVADAFPEGTSFGISFPPDAVMPLFFDAAVGWTSPIEYHYTAANNEVNDFLISVAAEAGTTPDQYDAIGMNAALAVVAALRSTNGVTDAATLRAALEGASFQGPKGKVDLRSTDHLAIQDTYIVTLVNTDDEERRYYDMVTTVRPEPPCSLKGTAAARCT